MNRRHFLGMGALLSAAAMPSIALAAPFVFTGGRMLPSVYDNTLTGLIPDLYAALDTVSRELVGFVPAVQRNISAERAAKGEAITWAVAPSNTSADIAPAMAVPEPADQTVGKGSITITKAKAAAFGYVGEQQLGLRNGSGYLSLQADQIAQALRVLVNEVEADLAAAAAAAGSRAYGTVGTIPFATNLGEAAQAKKILDDNGAPGSDRQMVFSTTVGASMRTLGQLTKANEAADTTLLRQGVLLDVHGFAMRESAQVISHVAGTNNGSASTNNAGYAIGATVLTLASAGTGTVLVGDVVTIAGDTNKYVVVAGDADVSNGGTITLAAPGLRKAIAASNTVITTIATHTQSVFFPRSAMGLVARAPAKPEEGDLRIASMLMTDPRSGLTFEVSIWPGYRKVRFEVGLAWGVAAVKPEHIGLLIN